MWPQHPNKGPGGHGSPSVTPEPPRGTWGSRGKLASHTHHIVKLLVQQETLLVSVASVQMCVHMCFHIRVPKCMHIHSKRVNVQNSNSWCELCIRTEAALFLEACEVVADSRPGLSCLQSCDVIFPADSHVLRSTSAQRHASEN